MIKTLFFSFTGCEQIFDNSSFPEFGPKDSAKNWRSVELSRRMTRYTRKLPLSLEDFHSSESTSKRTKDSFTNGGLKIKSRVPRSSTGTDSGGKELRSAPRHHQTSGGRVSLSGSSSSPVEPIQPLLNMGSSSSGALALPPNPIIDKATPRNVTGLQDNTAYLHCLVHNLGNKSVSISFL